MRKVRAPVAGLTAGERELDDASAHYLTRVLRLKEGESFAAFDPARGVEGDAVVVSAGERVVVRVGELRAGAAMSLQVTWIHSVAKADKLDAVVRDATELGATRFVAADTARSVVKLTAERGDARRARWERIAHEAARQAGRTEAPRVDGPLAWEAALASVDPGDARFLLWEQASEPLAPPLRLALAARRPLAFAVGPEGGITEDEARVAVAAGWVPASLGALILRTETVAAAVLGAVRIFAD